MDKKTWTGATLAAGGTAASVVNKYWTIVEGSDVPAAPVKVRLHTWRVTTRL